MLPTALLCSAALPTFQELDEYDPVLSASLLCKQTKRTHRDLLF